MSYLTGRIVVVKERQQMFVLCIKKEQGLKGQVFTTTTTTTMDLWNPALKSILTSLLHNCWAALVM